MSTFGQDIFVTALEGGIGYWAEATSIDRDAEGNYTGATFVDATGEGEFESVTVKATQLERAAREVLTHGIRSDLQEQLARGLKARDAAEIDADVADCVMQWAAFGEIVFG